MQRGGDTAVRQRFQAQAGPLAVIAGEAFLNISQSDATASGSIAKTNTIIADADDQLCFAVVVTKIATALRDDVDMYLADFGSMPCLTAFSSKEISIKGGTSASSKPGSGVTEKVRRGIRSCISER